ncbi:helix-turn-helix transcriptional regulator [Oceanobacillus oncorhynchi]|uniref:helix-turn-helix transcriptional regulator n=1 Tax=Oceanobacillus oncorhynchi TaxID=545501 RepID=UPI0034D6BAF7
MTTTDGEFLTLEEAAEQLGVSKSTLNTYIKQGLETVNISSQPQISKHTIELLKNPVECIRMQINFQEQYLRNQSPEERLSEINEKLSELQIKYNSSSFDEAFKDFNGDSMEDPYDYYLWRDLEEEKEEFDNRHY